MGARSNPSIRSIRAVVFDFDGLILDTETSVFEAWQIVYAYFGQELSMERWQRSIGTDGSGGFDPLAELERLAGPRLDVEWMQARRRQIRDTHAAQRDALPGVRRHLEQARRQGLGVAIASSSPADWVEAHVERLGLRSYFDTIVTRDDVSAGKPAPDLYIQAVARLDVSAERAIALEDSPNGVQAAKAAGLFCVAVPGRMTRGLSFDHADARLDTLGDTALDSLLELAQRR